MRKVNVLYLFVAIIILLAGAKFTRVDHLPNNSITSMSEWSDFQTIPFSKRIYPASDDLLSYLVKDNRKNGIPSIPRKVEVSDEIKAKLIEIFNNLPLYERISLEHKLAGIFFVSNLGSVGYTEAIKDQKNKPMAGFIVIDIKADKMSAGEWVTLRDTSPFEKGEYTFRTSITGNDNKPISALTYVFIHEAAHILGINSNLIPFWRDKLSSNELKRFKFLSISWKYNETEKILSPNVPAPKQQRSIKFFTREHPPNSHLLFSYLWLQTTSFPNLYSSSNFAEDFAESDAVFIVCHILHGRVEEYFPLPSGKISLPTSLCKSLKFRQKMRYFFDLKNVY